MNIHTLARSLSHSLSLSRSLALSLSCSLALSLSRSLSLSLFLSRLYFLLFLSLSLSHASTHTHIKGTWKTEVPSESAVLGRSEASRTEYPGCRRSLEGRHALCDESRRGVSYNAGVWENFHV